MSRERTVCVVGAGFAGLAAADALREAGMRPIVVEARDRVGGRVWTQRLPNGCIVERGAEFIDTTQDVILATVERLGLRIQGAGTSYSYREPRGGIGTTRDALLAAAETIRAELPANPARQGISVAAFLDTLPIDSGAREVIASRVQVSSAHPADDVSVEALSHHSFLPDEGLRVAEGNDAIAHRLAERLGDAIELSRPVEAVTWSEGGVRVHSGGTVVEADAGIIAVPASVIGRIRFDPPLPAWKADALRRVTYGHAAKLFVPLAETPPPSSVIAVPEFYWTWTGKGPDGNVQRVMSAFAGSMPALDRLQVRSGPAHWLQRVRALRPDLALKGDGVVLSTWSDDPWVGAVYSVVTPETPVDDADLLARPVGSLAFAGEHTAGPYHSSMNGALRSGLRAARDVLEEARGSRSAMESGS